MSNPSEGFECQWRPSRRLLILYLALLLLALLAPWLSALPLMLCLLTNAMCMLHACWALPRQVLLSAPAAFTALRKDVHGWQLYSQAGGWQYVRLRPDSLALPQMIVLRFHLNNRRWPRSVCIGADAMTPELHRRLRVLLKFSRKRWADPQAGAAK